MCVLGADRTAFLHGQITQQVKGQAVGTGGHGCLVNAKGKMHTDLFFHVLNNEILLDFEPGLAAGVTERLERFVIAEDVQIADASQAFGLLSFQGPHAAEVAAASARSPKNSLVSPEVSVTGAAWRDFEIRWHEDPEFGICYLARTPRLALPGYDWYVPVEHLAAAALRIESSEISKPSRWSGHQAWELARITAAIPRFGVDMDESTLPPEAGLESRAISYNKGCYIGQEVIARIRTYGEPARLLRGLRLGGDSASPPHRGALLLSGEREIGRITSVVQTADREWLGLGYVRKECKARGTALSWKLRDGTGSAVVATEPFVPFLGEHRD